MPEHVSFLCQKGKAVKYVKNSLEGNSHSARGRHGTILSFLVLKFSGRLKPFKTKLLILFVSLHTQRRYRLSPEMQPSAQRLKHVTLHCQEYTAESQQTERS